MSVCTCITQSVVMCVCVGCDVRVCAEELLLVTRERVVV